MFVWVVVLCQVLKGCFGVLMGCGTVSGFEGLFWCSYGLWHCDKF